MRRANIKIRYSRAQFARAEIEAADLIVRLLDAKGAVVVASPTMFNAPVKATIDLAISGAVAGQPSEYERLLARLTPLLEDVDPPQVSSLKSTDLEFLADETGASRMQLSDLLSAVALYQEAIAGASASTRTAAPITSAEVLVPALYGLLREGLPSGWVQLLQNGEATIDSSLTAAVSDGFIPAIAGHDASQIAAGARPLSRPIRRSLPPEAVRRRPPHCWTRRR